MNEITTITLDSELRTRDIDATEIELREAAAAPGGAEQTFHPDLGVVTYGDSLYREFSRKVFTAKMTEVPKVPNTGVGPSN